jgi:hypothetical protein
MCLDFDCFDTVRYFFCVLQYRYFITQLFYQSSANLAISWAWIYTFKFDVSFMLGGVAAPFILYYQSPIFHVY